MQYAVFGCPSVEVRKYRILALITALFPYNLQQNTLNKNITKLDDSI